MRVNSPVSQRLVLIGDAAHAIHPLSGHGINLGYQDAQKLSESSPPCLAGDPGDIETLRSYACARGRGAAAIHHPRTEPTFQTRQPLVSGLQPGMNLTNRDAGPTQCAGPLCGERKVRRFRAGRVPDCPKASARALVRCPAATPFNGDCR